MYTKSNITTFKILVELSQNSELNKKRINECSKYNAKRKTLVSLDRKYMYDLTL